MQQELADAFGRPVDLVEEAALRNPFRRLAILRAKQTLYAAAQPFVAGVYPLLQDETCFFLAVDFDKGGWRDDVTGFLETSRRLNLPAALERSRSGRGAHVWFFFEEAVPATLARRLGSRVITETMEVRPDIGLDSYDRLFPNQDTMPRGGFGNLIALPLQKGPRKQDNSVFLDDDFVPATTWFCASLLKTWAATKR